MISKETAVDIAFAYRDIEAAETLLKEIDEATKKYTTVDIRDAFGRRQDGLQLGVPSGNSSHRCFNVPWSLAKPVLEANIAAKRAELLALNEKARFELMGSKADIPQAEDHEDGKIQTA